MMSRTLALAFSCAAVVGASIACTNNDTRDRVVTTTSAGQLAVDSLLIAGDSLYMEQSPRAGELWAIARTLAEELKDSVRLARALTGLGQAAYQRGSFDSARAIGEQGLQLKERLSMSGEFFRSLNSLGLTAWRQERYIDALSLNGRAINAARALGDSLAIGKATLNRGLIQQELAQFDLARATMSDARDRLLAVGDSRSYGKALNNLAALDIAVGDLPAALAQLATARRLFARTSDNVGELNARGQLATAYAALGDPRRAFSAIDSATDLAKRLNSRAELADNLRITADMYFEAGDARRALDYYQRAASLTDSLGLREEHANLLRNEARALHATRNTRRAFQRASEALSAHTRDGFEYAAMRDRLLLAELAQQMRRPADAQAQLSAARAFATSIRVPIASAQVALVAARVAALDARWRDVIRELDAAAPHIRLISSDAIATQFALRARAQARLGNVSQAIADGRSALAAVEQIRDNFGSGELRELYGSSKSSVYADLTLVLLAAKRDSEAFAVADAARGRAILEHLSNARSTLRRDAGSARLAETEALLRRIDALVAALRQREQDSPRERNSLALAATKELQDSLRRARSEYEARRMRGTDGASPATRVLAPPAASLRHTQSALEPGELLVEYFATPDRLLIFLVSRTGFRLLDQPIPADTLATRVEFARMMMADRSTDDRAGPVLKALHTALMSPVIASGMMNDVRTLVIVPHGLLSYLPFAALVNPASNRFLIEDVNVLVAPSAAVLSALRATEVPSDPRTRGSTSSPPVVALAPLTRSLPGTLDELRGIRSSIPSVRELVGDNASERALRQVLMDDAIVHVASHAVMNPGNPQFSRVELARGADQSADDNGKLEVYEILGLNVRSPLVFLSGCETAVGIALSTGLREHEDFTSIAQAWLAAGAQNVVATLWRIDDVAAAEFTRHFYRALPTATVPEALAIAQRAMIKDPRHRRPYLWAAYQAVGDGRAPLSRGVSSRLETLPARTLRVSVSR